MESHSPVHGEEVDDDLNLDVVNKKSQAGKEKEEEKGDDEENFFEVEDAGSGDGFMATLPFKGSLVAPSHPRPFNPSPPDERLEVEYVWGYRSHDCRQNLCFTSDSNEIVFMTAAVGVVHNISQNTQRLFGGNENRHTKNFHSDDIVSLAIHPNRKLVATGEVGKNPSIFVWDSTNPSSAVSHLKQGTNSRAVKSLAFSASGRLLAASGGDDKHTIHVWEWETGKKVQTFESGTEPIYNMEFSAKDEETLAYCGKNGLKLLDVGSGKLHKGIFGKHGIKDIYCLSFQKDGHCITGAQDGSVQKWNGTSISKELKAAHKGFVLAVMARDEVVATAGKDNKLNLYDDSLKFLQSYTLPYYAMSLDIDSDLTVLIGTRSGEVLRTKGTGVESILTTHKDGEVWGLDIDEKEQVVVTTCDDNQILAYDLKTHKLLGKGTINPKPGKKYKIGGASTLSMLPPNQCARAICINKHTGHVAVGINTGELSVRGSVKHLNESVFNAHDAKEWIEVLRYSPDGKSLAVGSHDNNIYIYGAGTKGYSLKSVCAKHNSFITCFDWSVDSKYIRSVCGAYELLFFDATNGSQVTGGATSLRDTEWDSLTCKISWPCYPGIFPPATDGSHVNSVDLSPDSEVIATADDWGQINLYRNPAHKGARAHSFKAHSEHVVRVKFSSDKNYVYSVGGYDMTLVKWRIVRK